MVTSCVIINIPVILILPQDNNQWLQCRLYVEEGVDNSFTISLQVPIHLDGDNKASLFAVTYEPCNLLPGSSSLGDVEHDIAPMSELSRICRNGYSKNLPIKILALELSRPPGIIGPTLQQPLRSADTLKSKKGSEHEQKYQQFAKLVRATKVGIVLDCNQIQKRYLPNLQMYILSPRSYTGLRASVIPSGTSRYSHTSFVCAGNKESKAPPRLTGKSLQQGECFYG